MNENWKQWFPVDGLATKYDVDFVSDNFNEFKIILEQIDNKKNKVHLIFENSVPAYRVTYESFRQILINQLDEKYGSDFYNWTFFKVKNSEYLKWLEKQSGGFFGSKSSIHFVLLTSEEVIDIAAHSDPKIEFINE